MNIKVKDLKQTETIENSDKFMVLVDDDLNLVKNITKEELLTNFISSKENNALIQETDGNLYVNTSEISDSITALDTKFTNKIGDLNNLTTENKTNLVSAINEAAQSSASGHYLLELVPSIFPIDDAGVHLTDGSLISQSGVYAQGVEKIKEIAAQYPQFSKTEEEWQALKTQYGEVPCVVIDDTAGTLRLPLIINPIKGVTDFSNLAQIIEAGVPNATGSVVSLMGNPAGNQPGALTTSHSNLGQHTTGGSGDLGWRNISLDLSRANSIYGNSNTVQPQQPTGCYYIVLATSTKTNIQVDIDNIASDLNLKLDKATVKRYITETYNNGSSGYEIYNDGYCVQWGRITTGQTVTYLKTFRDKNYNLTFGNGSPTSYTGTIQLKEFGWYGTNGFTATGFTGTADANHTKDWCARGYLAEGEY